MPNGTGARDIHSDNVKGKNIEIGVTGSNNVIGKNININKQQLENMSEVYAESLKTFIELIKKYNIPSEQVEPIQNSLNDFVKEVQEFKPEEKASAEKKMIVYSKFLKLAVKILNVLPKTSQTITCFTPLEPFSMIIGKSVEHLVEELQKDKY
jgi:hypothetical protein